MLQVKIKLYKGKPAKMLLNKWKFYYLQFIDIKNIYFKKLPKLYFWSEGKLSVYIYIYREREGKINVKDLK